MTCDLDRVDALADGRLDGPEAKEVMEHLAGCPQCRAYYEGALAADRVLADTGINPPADFAAGVMERIRPRRQVQWPRAAAGLAACLLLAAGALSGQRASFGRMLAGSGLAALSALILFAPEQPYPVQLAYKIATALAITAAAFGWRSVRRLVTAACWYQTQSRQNTG